MSGILTLPCAIELRGVLRHQHKRGRAQRNHGHKHRFFQGMLLSMEARRRAAHVTVSKDGSQHRQSYYRLSAGASS
jgi:hypothetical protein